MVRRRLVRSVEDIDTLTYIMMHDGDASVRDTAEKRLTEVRGT